MSLPVTCPCGCEFEVPAAPIGGKCSCPACGKGVPVADRASPLGAGTTRHTSPKKRISGWIWLGGGCLGTLVLAIIVAIALPMLFVSRWFAEGQRQLDTEVALLAATSEPSTPEELEAYYSLPAGTVDTTRLWIEGSTAFETDAFRQQANPLPGVGASGAAALVEPGQPWAALPAIRQLLAAYRPDLAKLHEAARLGGAARYATSFDEGFAAENPHVPKLRMATRMLQLEAYLAAHDGDSRGAWRAITTMLQLAHSLENSPQVIDQLVRIASFRIICQTLFPLLPFLDVDDQTLAQFIDQLADDDYDQGLIDEFYGERVQGLHAFENPDIAIDEVDAERVKQWTQKWMQRDRAYYLRHMRRLIEAAREPWPERLAATKRVGDEIGQLRQDNNKLVQAQHLLSILLHPAEGVLVNAVGNAVALRDASIVMLAIERYHLRHRRWPESLGQLVPEFIDAVPQDPFDGQPLRYRLEANRHVVYSIGENLLDDGGAADRSRHLDLVLFVDHGEE